MLRLGICSKRSRLCWESLLCGFVVKEPDLPASHNALMHLPKDRFKANRMWILVL